MVVSCSATLSVRMAKAEHLVRVWGVAINTAVRLYGHAGLRGVPPVATGVVGRHSDLAR